jgi:hypothetical protein
MSTRPGSNQKPGKVLTNPVPGPGVVWKGLFLDLECPVVTEYPAVCPHHAQLVMEHFVVNDIFDHEGRNRQVVQHRVNPYDSFVRPIASEADASRPASSVALSPGDGAAESASEIDLVEPLEIVTQIDMLSLRMKARGSRLYRDLGGPDLIFMGLDEGSQQIFVPDGRPTNERGKRSQHILRRIEKHLMKADHAGPVSPSHRDHGSRVVRDGQTKRYFKKCLQP